MVWGSATQNNSVKEEYRHNTGKENRREIIVEFIKITEKKNAQDIHRILENQMNKKYKNNTKMKKISIKNKLL